jgi:hypothetical protein
MEPTSPLAPERAQAWPIHLWERHQLAIRARQEAKTLSHHQCPPSPPACSGRKGPNPCGAGRLPKGTQKDGGRGSGSPLTRAFAGLKPHTLSPYLPLRVLQGCYQLAPIFGDGRQVSTSCRLDSPSPGPRTCVWYFVMLSESVPFDLVRRRFGYFLDHSYPRSRGNTTTSADLTLLLYHRLPSFVPCCTPHGLNRRRRRSQARCLSQRESHKHREKCSHRGKHR